jgi:hypothetical protein
MNLSPTETQLRDEFFHRMLEATFPMQQQGPDAERTLHALIAAAVMLKQRFENELAELRQEAD